MKNKSNKNLFPFSTSGRDDRKKKRKEKDHSENKSSKRPVKDGCGECSGCLQTHDCGQYVNF